MKVLLEEYGDVIVAISIVIIIMSIVCFVLPFIQDTVTPFLESVGVI